MHNYIVFTQIRVLNEFRKARKSSKFDLKMRAKVDFSISGSSHCRDKAKNYRDKKNEQKARGLS